MCNYVATVHVRHNLLFIIIILLHIQGWLQENARTSSYSLCGAINFVLKYHYTLKTVIDSIKAVSSPDCPLLIY